MFFGMGYLGVLTRRRSVRNRPLISTIAALSPVPPMSMARILATVDFLLVVFLAGRFAGIETVFLLRQVERGIDQSDMGKGLGKIAQHPLVFGIILFREQSDIVGITL